MYGRGYNRFPNKRQKIMSGDSSRRPTGRNESASKDFLASAFLNAEEQFQTNDNEWKESKGRKHQQNKPSKPRDDLRNKLERDRSRGSDCNETRQDRLPPYRQEYRPHQNKPRGDVRDKFVRDRSGCSDTTDSRANRLPSNKHESRFNQNKRPYDTNQNFNKRPNKSSVNSRNSNCSHESQSRHEKQDDDSYPNCDSRSNQKKAEKTHTPQQFSYTKLQHIAAKDSTDIIRVLANSQNGLDEFLKGEIRPDIMFLVIKILKKLTESDWEENKQHVLMRVTTPEFFKKISIFVACLATDQQTCKRLEEMENFFENLLIFYNAVLTVLPTVAADHLMGPLRATHLAMNGAVEYHNVAIKFNLFDKIKKLMLEVEERKKEKEERERVIRETQETIYPKPLGSIKDIPLFPRPEDIACRQGQCVKNKIKGPYNNIEHYLDVQFRLLREDFIAPLRQGINEYRVGSETKPQGKGKKTKVNNIRIYPRVKFLKPKVIADKVGYDVCIDPEKRLKVRWEYTKRFIFGSLLLFTTDNFHTFFLATVVRRDLNTLEKDRIISVILSDTTELAQDILSKEFLMAESEIYFEPYYNVLKALQKFNSDTFPMSKYFVYVNVRTDRPAYTRNGSDVFTISVDCNGLSVKKTMKLFEDSTWPSCEELGFDRSQLRAYKAALTNELVVIQGPPGTGKTFIGLKIAEALLENSSVWNFDRKSPILVICYTNHALDQFLEGILQKGLTNHLIRIGGRSKSELLEPFNLRERRRSAGYFCPNHDQASLLKDLKREMSEIFENIKILQDNLEHLDKNDGILSLKTLKIVIQTHHEKYFKNNDDLIEWLLHGISNKMSDKRKLFSTEDKGIVLTRKTGNALEEFGFNSEDFENAARLREVLFDSFDLEDPDNLNAPNSQLAVNFSCTLDEIQRKIEETSKLLEVLPDSEGSRETLQEKIKKAKREEADLKTILDYFGERLKRTGIPSQEETNRVCAAEDVNALSSDQRWTLYKSWIEFLKAGYWMMIGKLEERYRRGALRYDEVRQFDDLRIVQDADVVGMTTSTAARLQAMLRELKPKIVIVEEAAEVLEAHIVASLSVYCQHLILIGDHKQLRPSPSDYRMGKDFHLDVSLFERLINNGVNFYTLTTQHRMRPEISRLLVPTIYPSLQDHPSTLTRQRVRGMERNLFFMTHNNVEEENEDIKSKRNPFEARMVMLLARHLLLQGYRPDEITVLTTYNGQMYLLKQEQQRLEISKELLVTVVDNFQGEENKIILLSLVRSNEDNKIGFLKTDNRVCVALSRARDGLFVFGNMDCLTAGGGELWQKIKKSFVDQGAFGPSLTLRCETHQNQLTRIMTENDFNSVREGGCSRPCNESLPCGHSCKSLCHVSKDRHTRYRCSEPCNRVLCKDHHPCTKKCYQPCPECKLSMVRTLPCGHQITLECCVDYSKIQCKQLVTLKFEECNHEVKVECYRRGVKQCPEPCLFRVDCGHACTRTCHVLDDPDHINYLCPKPCARPPVGCSTEGHKCPLPCCDPCQPCEAMVKKNLECGHSLTVRCTEKALLCPVVCNRVMDCGHNCKKKCYEECGDCRVKVEKVVGLCGHKVTLDCCLPATKEYCRGQCAVRLACGHKCAKRCKDRCTVEDCVELTKLDVPLPCGHKGALVPCNLRGNLAAGTDKEQLLQYCSEPCLEVLKCGHRCSGNCGQCMQGRIHKVCDEDCGNTLICGHSCTVPCRQICPPCEKKCQNRCMHTKCPKKCGEPCVPCNEPCEYRCVHTRCTKKCGDLCNRKPCTEPCMLTLSCDHPCVGYCGEPCPPCKQCHPDHYEMFFGTEDDDPETRWILLNDCKHVVEASGLEHWLGMDQEGSEIKLKACPKCRPTEPNRYIATTQRYMNLVKKTFLDIQAVKKKLYGEISDIRAKRKELLKEVKKIPATEMTGFAGSDKEKCELYQMYLKLLKDLPIVWKDRRKEIDKEQLCVFDYKVDFLTTMISRNKEIWGQLNDETKLKMLTKVNTLTKALNKREKKISNLEIESFQLEVNRIFSYGDLLKLESSGEFKELKSKSEVIQAFKTADDLINKFTRFTSDHGEKVDAAIAELKKAIKSNATLTAKERREIHLAMSKDFYGGSSAQGHWFKCPNGHFYCITECGGAMQTAKCPERGCGAMIGGQNHRYLPGQTVASEMDGATRPAWSTGYDMRNFDLNNLH